MATFWNDLFPGIDKPLSVTDAIQIIKNLKKEYGLLIKQVTKVRTNYRKDINVVISTTKKLDKAILSIVPSSKKASASLKKLAVDVEETAKKYGVLTGKIRGLNKTISALSKEQQKYSDQVKKTLKVEADLKALKKSLISMEKKHQAEINRLTGLLKKKTEETKKGIKEDDRQTKLTKKLAFLSTEQAKKEAILSLKIQDKTKKLKESVKQSAIGVSQYQKESKRLSELRIKYKDAALLYGINSKEAKSFTTELRSLDRTLKKVDKSAGQFGRNVGNYPKMFSNVMLGITGFVFAVAGLVRGFGKAISTFVQFEVANAKLRGVLGATSAQTAELTQQQLELGKSTEFSATEVAKAQTELAKLGRTEEEIISLTPSILSAATAFGVELAPAAALVAGQLNAFKLEASEGARVADTLAKATQISAFDFKKLETALGIVSPAAKAVNITLERQLGIMSAAVDANIDASAAATALRNIFIDLADQGMSWDDAMQLINSRTDKLSVANQLFGKRGAVVASVIANNTEKIDQNTIALENAAGTAKKFADEQLNTLAGDVKILTSAWEGFLLGIEKGDGLLSKFIRGSLKGLTSLLGTVTSEVEDQSSSLEVQRQKFNSLIGVLINLNPKEEEAAKIMNILNTEYSRFLPSLIKEVTTKEQLINIQKSVNDEILNTILLRHEEERIQEISAAQINAVDKILELQEEKNSLLKEEGEILVENAIATGDLTEEEKKRNDLLITNAKTNSDQTRIDSERVDLIDKEIERLRKLAEGGNRLAINIKERSKALRELLGLNRDNEDSNYKLGQSVEDVVATLDGIDSKTIPLDLKLGDLTDVKEAISNFEIEPPEINWAEVINAELGRALVFVEAYSNAAFELFSALNARKDQQDEQRIEVIEEQRKKDLEGAKDNEQLQGEINETADKKKAAIEKRQAIRARKLAIADKALAISGIILNTALGISKALATGGLPLVPLIAGIGALQLATAIAQPLPPIPQFAKGTDNAPGGMSIVGEEGTEMIIKPSGEVGLTGNKAHLMDVPSGSTILTHAITKDILSQTSENNKNDSGSIKNAITQGKVKLMADEMRKHNKIDSEILLSNMQRVFDSKPIQEIKFRHGELVSDLVKGGTTLKNWKQKNSD